MSSATATAPKEKMWVMPEVHIGDTVLWFMSGVESHHAPYPAIVTKVAEETVALAAFAPELYTLLLNDGVRHIADPRNKKIDLADSGAWKHRPEHKRLADLEAQVDALMGAKAAGSNSQK
jgi:hypothetical protein